LDNESSLLLVTHVAIRSGDNGPLIDDQTAAGIRQWCGHFDRVTYYGIQSAASDASSVTWVDASPAAFGGAAQVRWLPRGYSPGAMASQLSAVWRILGEQIDVHRHLCFTIGGLLGDWPALGALAAIRRKRRYAAWIDRVEVPVMRQRLADASVAKRAGAALLLPTMEAYTRYILRQSAVALLQGHDTYDHYAGSAPNPHVTYDTHTHESDEIEDDALAAKVARVTSGAPLRIIYVGRAAPMKGPLDWIDAMRLLHARGVPLRATWIGDGPQLPEMRERVAQAGMQNVITLPGFQSDHQSLLSALRDHDLLAFCHKTPESARCLVEALVSGCAIVGYETSYPRGLIESSGGGALTAHDPGLLAERIFALHEDRKALGSLVRAAATSGKRFNERDLYAHRAGLMKCG
jgi:colanic acid/amylovoran biosynthesis glycosyltransferase